MASMSSCWFYSQAAGDPCHTYCLVTRELGSTLPDTLWVTCPFGSQSAMAGGWDLLIGLVGSHGSFLDQSLFPGGHNAFIGHTHTHP